MCARAALTLFLAAGFARPAAAQAIPAAEAPAAAAAPAPTREDASRAEGRALNGHVFMPSVAVPGALNTTSFASYLVLGYGEASGFYQLGDRAYSGSFDYAGAGSVLGYEHAFLKYFSARFALEEVIYSGIDGPSAIVVGTSLQVSVGLGLTASLPLTDALRVGVLLDVGSSPGLGLTIANGLQTIIADCQAGDCRASEGAIFGTHRATTLQPALAANWAPWRPLGFTANVAYQSVRQRRSDDTFTGEAVKLGGAADFDFLAVSGAPVGLQLAVSWTAPFRGEPLQHVTDLGGGIFYTGRQHLALGLQVLSRRFAVQPTVNVSWGTFISTIGLRYYW